MTGRGKPGRCGATVASLAAFAITVAYAPALATGGDAAEAPPEVPAAAEVAKRDAEVLKRPIGPDQSKSPKPDEQPSGEAGAGSGAPTDPPAEPSSPDQPKTPDQPKAPGAGAGGPSGKPPGHHVPSPGHGGPRPGNGHGPPATPPGHAKPDPPSAGNPGKNDPGSSPGQGKPGTGGEPGRDNPGQGKGPNGLQPEPQPDDGQGKGPTGGQGGPPPDEGQGKAPSGGRPQSDEPPARADRGSEPSQPGQPDRSAPGTQTADPSASTGAEGSGRQTGTRSAPPDRPAEASEPPAEPTADPVAQSGTAPHGDDAGNGQPPRNRQAETEAAPTADRKSGGVVFVSGVPTEVLLGLVAFALTAAGLAIGLLREHRRYREVEQDALTDPVTGLANRIAFEHQLALDWQRALRYERPLGVLVIDLDDFKRTNDTRGHVAGDRVLRETAETIAREVRGGDVAARLGGDEFVVLAAETQTDGLEILAHRLRGALAERGIAASVGCAERTADDGAASQVLDRADHAMYEDKEWRKSAGPAVAGTARG